MNAIKLCNELQWSAVYPGTFYLAMRLSVLLRNDSSIQTHCDIAFRGGYLKKRLSDYSVITKNCW